MKKIAIAAALPFALTLAACDSNEEIDGTDTTSMEAETVDPMDVGTSDPVVTDETMMAEEPMTDDVETDPMTMEPVETQ
jgi:outer membrane lipoprotein SlyB